MFHSIVKLFDGSYFMFGGRESPLKPCLDYGFFKIDAMNHDDNTDEGEETGQGKSILIYRWRDELSSHPSSHSGDVRKKPCPRWRHSATGIFIAGISNSFLNSFVFVYKIVNVTFINVRYAHLGALFAF